MNMIRPRFSRASALLSLHAESSFLIKQLIGVELFGEGCSLTVVFLPLDSCDVACAPSQIEMSYLFQYRSPQDDPASKLKRDVVGTRFGFQDLQLEGPAYSGILRLCRLFRCDAWGRHPQDIHDHSHQHRAALKPQAHPFRPNS